MNEQTILQQALELTMRDLIAYVRKLSVKLNDSILNQLLSDASSLMRSKEIVSAMDKQGQVKLNGSPSSDLAQFSQEPVFNLRQSIKYALADVVGQEINTPILYRLMIQLHPNEDIKQSSVSANMSKLKEDGYLEETHAGKGKDPKRYKVLKGDVKEG